MIECPMCLYQENIHGNKTGIPPQGSVLSDMLILHWIFKEHHPEEDCRLFRETEKIKKFRKELERELESILGVKEKNDN